MKVVAHHRIEFRCTNDKDIELPIIIDPVYIYEVGDRIKFYNALAQDDGKGDILALFEVVEVNHELHDVTTGEQVTDVVLKKERQ